MTKNSIHDSHLKIQQWIEKLRINQFSLLQAYQFTVEFEALASPFIFQKKMVTQHSWMKDLKNQYLKIKNQLQAIQTPSDWENYLKHIPNLDTSLFLNSLSHPKVKNLEKPHFLKTWVDLEKWIEDKLVLPILIEESQNLKEIPKELSLQETLEKSGLRSIRWSFFETVSEKQISYLILKMQNTLLEPLGWDGPFLGLNGETGLIFISPQPQKGTGQVLLDPKQSSSYGQQLYLDTLNVLAHEWLHTVDVSLAKKTKQMKSWATLSIVDGEDFLPANVFLQKALISWWEQVLLIQFLPLPKITCEEIKIEIQNWPERFLESFEQKEKVKYLIYQEQILIENKIWDVRSCKQRWLDFLEEFYPYLSQKRKQRTASLLAHEIKLAQQPDEIPFDEPLWTGFLNSMEDEEPPLKNCTDCHSYLVNPVEIMARSFEVSFQTNEPNVIWPQKPPLGGMIWPLMAERKHQKEGWVICLKKIKNCFY